MSARCIPAARFGLSAILLLSRTVDSATVAMDAARGLGMDQLVGRKRIVLGIRLLDSSDRHGSPDGFHDMKYCRHFFGVRLVIS